MSEAPFEGELCCRRTSPTKNWTRCQLSTCRQGMMSFQKAALRALDWDYTVGKNRLHSIRTVQCVLWVLNSVLFTVCRLHFNMCFCTVSCALLAVHSVCSRLVGGISYDRLSPTSDCFLTDLSQTQLLTTSKKENIFSCVLQRVDFWSEYVASVWSLGNFTASRHLGCPQPNQLSTKTLGKNDILTFKANYCQLNI